MGLRTAKILQAFFVVMLAWYVYSTLAGWHWLLVLVLVVVSLTNTVAIWMLRHNRDTVASLSRYEFVAWYVGLLCRAIGLPRPVDERPGATAKQILLSSGLEFEMAVDRALQVVRGHDQVLENILARVHENTALRSNRRSNKLVGPIASFLLVGKPGVGKRYLSRVVSKLLYRSGRVEVFDCGLSSLHSLVGTKGQVGDLLELVRSEPYQMIIFENVEQASKEVSAVLCRVLASGELEQPGATSPISFRNTTIVFTTTKLEATAEIDADSIGRAAWERRALERLRDEAHIDAGLLNAIDDVYLCESPSDETKAEVISLLMQKECRAHGIELSYVDPLILGAQVLQVDDATGFSHSASRVKKMLSKPLVAASTSEHDSLSLRVAEASPEPSQMQVNSR